MNDNFEDFLKKEITKSSFQSPDNGFSDRVVANLPKRKRVFARREVIIITSALFSALAFILTKGFYPFIEGVTSLFNSFIYQTMPNYEFVIVLLAFIFISVLIPLVELRKRVL